MQTFIPIVMVSVLPVCIDTIMTCGVLWVWIEVMMTCALLVYTDIRMCVDYSITLV